MSLPLWVVGPLAIAAIIHAGVPVAKFFRLMVFLPAVLSPVVIGAYYNVSSATTARSTVFLRDIGLGGLARQWLNDPDTALAGDGLDPHLGDASASATSSISPPSRR